MSIEPSHALRQVKYEQYIKPHLNNIPAGQTLLYFFDQSWRAWLIGIDGNDIKNMLFIQWVCRELAIKDKMGVIEIISKIWDELHDVRVITERSIKAGDEGEELEGQYSRLLEQYKTLYECEFRLWGTIPYCYTVENLKPSERLSNFSEYVSVGAGKKLATIRGVRTTLIVGDLKQFVRGIDNKIRNAKAHDRWEVNDEGALVIDDYNPHKNKSRGKIELTLKEVEDKIKVFERRLWGLEVGLHLYIENHPEIRSELQSSRTLKIKEIERLLGIFVEQRQLKLNKFSFDTERKILEIELERIVVIAGEGGEILASGGFHADVVVSKDKVKYKNIVLDVLLYALQLNRHNTFEAKVKVFDEDGEKIIDIEYESSEIYKLGSSKRPRPKIGKVTNKSYDLVVTSAVPTGMRAIFKKMQADRAARTKRKI